jgi:hypothetical protein
LFQEKTTGYITKMTQITFDYLYEKITDENEVVSAFIYGHLVTEFFLKKLIYVYDSKLGKLSDSLSFYKLINLNYELGTLTPNQKETLLLINNIRNKFAHELSYVPSLVELRRLLEAAAKSFSDLTDGIEQGLSELKSVKTIEETESIKWVIQELFTQIAYDLFAEYEKRGGKDITEC